MKRTSNNGRNRQQSRDNSLSPASETLVLGRRAAAELLRHGRERVKEVLVATGARFDDDLESLLRAGLPLRMVAAEELDALAGEVPHQGLALVAIPRVEITTDELIVKSIAGNGLIVVLDQVSDPHNFGAVLRASECAGADGVCISDRRSAPLSPVARKASAGASEIIPIARATNLQRFVENLKAAGFWVVGTALAEGSQSIYSYSPPERLAVVLGAEGTGLRALTAKECDLLVHIPLYGLISSLNVSQAAAVILFELARQRRG